MLSNDDDDDDDEYSWYSVHLNENVNILLSKMVCSLSQFYNAWT